MPGLFSIIDLGREQNELAHKFARAAHGHQRDVVMWAGGVMILNGIKQSHAKLVDAERELEDVIARMRAALRENHYDSNGELRVTKIVAPHPSIVMRDLLRADGIPDGVVKTLLPQN